MKTFIFYYLKLFASLLLLLMVVSCQKKSEFPITPMQTNYIVRLWNDSKTAQEYNLVTNLGHDGKNCNGCVLRHGRFIHIDCQGHGNMCQVSANMTLNIGGSEIYAVTTDTFGLTDQNYFNMPARSLSAEDEKGQPVFLNIPAQLVYRDSTTLQFTLNGLYYSNSAVYSND